MPTANEVQHEALVNLMQMQPHIRRMSRADSTTWTTQDGLYAQAVMCFLDSYLTMLSQPAPCGHCGSTTHMATRTDTETGAISRICTNCD